MKKLMLLIVFIMTFTGTAFAGQYDHDNFVPCGDVGNDLHYFVDETTYEVRPQDCRVNMAMYVVDDSNGMNTFMAITVNYKEGTYTLGKVVMVYPDGHIQDVNHEKYVSKVYRNSPVDRAYRYLMQKDGVQHP